LREEPEPEEKADGGQEGKGRKGSRSGERPEGEIAEDDRCQKAESADDPEDEARDENLCGNHQKADEYKNDDGIFHS
jgi:hypothetical protein